MIRRLRALELPLEEVRAVLAADPGEQRMAAATRILDELSRLIDGKEDLVPELLDELGVEPVEPCTITLCPFADSEGFVDVENTVLVPSAEPGRGRIQSRILEACTAVCLTHKGPYDELSRSYDVLSRWIAEQDLETAGPPREIYWTDPQKTADPGGLRDRDRLACRPGSRQARADRGLRGREAHETGDRLKESAGSRMNTPPSSGRSVLK